ncbi:MAG: lysophospholipase [Caldisericia bacterium]|nr:lysophospholipase [Caldisericia bacterium]
MENFFNFKGYKIFYHSNGLGEKGKIFIVHGLGEHIGRYERIEKILVNSGYMVEGIDLIGHGRSSGIRGDIPSFEVLFEIFDEALKFNPKNEVFLLGHSLGGLIGYRYLQEREGFFKKAIISSGIFNLNLDELPKGLVYLAKFLNSLYPKFTMSNRINPEDLSRNEEEVKKYILDPLVHNKISVRLFFEIYKNTKIALQKGTKTPILILFGAYDKVVPPISAKLLYDSIFGDKLIKEYPMKHELFNDPEGDKVIEDILEFLKS